MSEKITLEQSQKLAALMEILLAPVDMIIANEPGALEQMDRAIAGMSDHHGTLQALPFPETLNKADDVRLRLQLLEAIRGLVAARLGQREAALKGANYTTGADVLERLGL